MIELDRTEGIGASTLVPADELDEQYAREFIERGSSLYDSVLWVTFEALASQNDGLPGSGVAREMINHHIMMDEQAIACDLLREQKEGKSESSPDAADRRSPLAFTDKLAIFRTAVGQGAMDVLAELGDLRSEAEARGPEVLGQYLLEELRVGWNVYANLDAVAVIKQHASGRLLQTKDALGELAARLLVGGEEQKLDWLLSQETDKSLPIDPQAKLYIAALRRGVILSDITGMRAARKLQREAGYRGSTFNWSKEALKDRYSKLHIRLWRNFPEALDMQPQHATLFLALIDEESRQSIAAGTEEIQQLVANQLSDASSGVQLCVREYCPEFVAGLAATEHASLAKWYEGYISIDAKKVDGNLPYNIRFLDKLSTYAQSAIIHSLGKLSRDNNESDQNTRDDQIQQQVLAEMDVLQAELDARQPHLLLTDTVDKLRFQSDGNRAFTALFKRAERISCGAQRLEVLYAVYCAQKNHDSTELDSTIDSMRSKIISVATRCLESPLDRALYGEQNLHAMLEELTSKGVVPHEDIHN